MTQTDSIIPKLLAHPTATEARSWLAQRDGIVRTLGESDSPDVSALFVEDLYAAGVVAVIATEIDSYEHEALEETIRYENTGHLVLKLPADPKMRRAVFRLHAKVARGLGFDPTPDVGQEYLYCALD